MELPPAHVDTAQQRRILRSNPTAARVRAMFPRGTRVEATRSAELPGNGRFGTIIDHIPGSSADGGRLTVLWDVDPFTGGPRIGRGIWAGALLIVRPGSDQGDIRAE